MHREDPCSGPSTSTSTPPYPTDDRGRLLDLDGRQGNTMPSTAPMQPLPPLETVAHHGNSPNLPPMDAAGFKINRWQNRNFDSGVQTMVHSQTQSLMSLHPSEISVMSGMTDDVSRQELTETERCRFERLSIGPEGSGLIELVQLMKEDNEAVVLRATHMMQNIAKMDAEQRRERIITGSFVVAAVREIIEKRAQSPNIIRVALCTLFHLCSHPDGLADVMELVGNEPSLLDHLIRHTRKPSFSFYKYAILSLHSILSDRSALGMAAAVEARQRDALTPLVEVLRPDQSEKLLPIIADIIKILCEKNNEQKKQLIEQGGVPRLLDILQRCNYENLLWRVTKLLSQIANYSPSSLMTCSAPSILHTRLGHGSVRLVHSVLDCLRAISDVASPPNVDATPVLSSIMCLFGNNDLLTSLYSVQILSNMIANNRRNKEFVTSKGAVPTLLRVLYESTILMGTEKQQEMCEDIQESLLCCLHHLCVRNEYAQQVCTHVMAVEPVPGNPVPPSRLLLDRLYNMRPAVLRQTLIILMQTAPLNENLRSFRETHLVTREEIPLTFIHQIVIIMRVAFYQFPSAQHGVDLKVENVKVVDLVSSTLSILASLCRDPRMLQETVYFFLQPLNSVIGERHDVFLPLYALEQPFIHDNAITGPALSLLNVLAVHPHVSSILSSNLWLCNVLQTHARQQEQAIAGPAQSLLNLLYAHSHDRMQPQYDNYQQYGSSSSTYGSYPMASSYPPPAHHHHHHPHPPAVPPPMTGPLPPSSLPSSSRLQPSPESTPTHNLSGRSDNSSDNIGPWPEDLPLEGDPFAQVFCSPSSPPSPAPVAVFDAYTHPLPPPANQYPPPHSHLPYPDPYHPHTNY